MLNTNIGVFERVIRVAAGVCIIALAFIGPKSPWGFFGFVPLITGIIGWCPPYALLGIKTKKCRH